MIYNTRSQSNDTIENQNEKNTYFNVYAGGKQKLTGQCIVNKQISKVDTLGITCTHDFYGYA